MFIRRKLALFAILICGLFVLGNSPAMAAARSCERGIGEVAARSSPQGIKSAVIVRAVKLVAKGIRHGNKHFGKILSKLDDAAVGPFLQHSGKIADVLKGIAKIPDLVLGVVGQQLFHLLSDKQGAFKIAPGTAKVIVEGIMFAINAAL